MKRGHGLASAVVCIVAVLTLAACGGSGGSGGSDFDGVGDCTPIQAAVSSEKVGLMARLSSLFQDSPEGKGLAHCAAVVPTNVASGEAAGLLGAGWPKDSTDKPQPVIWSPASTSWVTQVAGRLGSDSLGESASIARSPLVIAMPEQMARQLGWPSKPVDLRALHDLCLDPKGWGRFGAAQSTWGRFKLGKTNPETSTSGQNMLLMQDYAAVNKQKDLTVDDITAGADFSRELESCVIHYGDTTGNVLQRVYDLDQEGKPLDYVSAVAVEETSVINYNMGNPSSGVVKDGTQLTAPRKKLVAVYPSGGSLQSDNPLVVLNTRVAPWASAEQRTAAQAFLKFAQSPAAQSVLGDFGFRPADPAAAPGGKVTADYGVDPKQPTTLLPQPSPEVTAAAKQQWNSYRKPSSVLELLDVSGSMGQPVSTGGPSRIDAAIASASATLGHFRPTDNVGVQVFTTDNLGAPTVTTIPTSRRLAGMRRTCAISSGRCRPSSVRRCTTPSPKPTTAWLPVRSPAGSTPSCSSATAKTRTHAHTTSTPCSPSCEVPRVRK